MPSSFCILLAEDNRVSQRVAQAMLQALGHSVEIRSNGKEAVDACLAGHFDLVLMDGYMPVMDGFEATREIRRLERGRRTPIVALTATENRKDWQRCFDTGMDGFLAKPLSIVALASALERWIPAASDTAISASAGRTN
jgi:CheY-like chemotaxis protein